MGITTVTGCTPDPLMGGTTVSDLQPLELIVFTNNGQTYYFNNVQDFKPTTTGFSFTYEGKATGVTRQATFNNTSTAGYALA